MPLKSRHRRKVSIGVFTICFNPFFYLVYFQLSDFISKLQLFHYHHLEFGSCPTNPCFISPSIMNYENASRISSQNKRLSRQPTLGALTFLRSFVAGKLANFCRHLASVVHFTVVKSRAILIIRLGVVEVISAVTLYLMPASKRRNFYLVGYVQAQQFACRLCLSIVALTATMCLYNVSRGNALIKRKEAKKHQYPTFPDQYLPTPLGRSETL